MFKKMILMSGVVIGLSSNAWANDWSVGKEVEVDPGRYVTLFDSFDGWDVWKIETKSSFSCHARKFESGKRQLPYKGIFFSAGAGLGLDLTRRGEVYWAIYHKTSSSYGKAEYRFDGDRFTTDLVKASYVNYSDTLAKNRVQLDQLKARSNESLTIFTSDWEHRAVKVGYEALEAKVSLSGISKAEERLVSCGTENL